MADARAVPRSVVLPRHRNVPLARVSHPRTLQCPLCHRPRNPSSEPPPFEAIADVNCASGRQRVARHDWVWNPDQTRIMTPIGAVESPVRHHSSDNDDSSPSHKPCRTCTRNCRSQPVRHRTMTTHTARRLSSSRAWPQGSFDHNWSMNRWSSSKSQHSRNFSSCTRYRRTL